MPEIKMASELTLAERNIEQRESYHKGDGQSSPNLKEFLGVLLLRLVAGQAEPDDWQQFDRLLRRYYALKRLTRASL
jgi:hypothetical protein